MTLLIIDGSNAIHRAHYAVPKMSYNGTPTNAIVGFMNIVKSNLTRTGAKNCAIVFDRPGENHRHRLFPEYKAGRVKHPEVKEALDLQIPIIVDLCRACGLRVVGKRGIEGDDIIGQLGVDYVEQTGKDVNILSGDKDFGQLLRNKKIALINPNKGLITRKNIESIFGVPARQVVDYLMLEGDDIDNIPGVYGVGPKTAISLLKDYRRVEDIPADAFPKSWRERYGELQKQFALTRQLLTLKLDVMPGYDMSRLRRGPKDQEALQSLCAKFGLTKLYWTLMGM